MIRRVWEQASLAQVDALIVATDDDRIYDHVAEFGRVIMTSRAHASGTDRCAEVAAMMDRESAFDVVINIQGDQPFIDPALIDQVASACARDDVDIATLSVPITQVRDVMDAHIVKVVVSGNGRALYFSRSPIPFIQGKDKGDWVGSFPFQKHIGTYAYKRHVLTEIAALSPSPLEEAEQLEQLRWIEGGYSIAVIRSETDVRSIDKPEDV